MTTKESFSCRREELLPDDLNEIISHNLIPAGYPGKNTEKYLVRGYPHLLVRHNKRGEPIEKIRHTAQVFNGLSEYGIDALPYIPVEHEGEAYVVTLNVVGKNLDDILKEGADCEMIESVDELWARLVAYIAACKREGKPCAEDIYIENQYMYGTVCCDDTPRLWLVDLGEWTMQLSGGPISARYADEIEDILYTILALEDKVKKPLLKSRQAVECATNDIDSDRIAARIRKALKQPAAFASHAPGIDADS